jgi:hypothetical protein
MKDIVTEMLSPFSKLTLNFYNALGYNSPDFDIVRKIIYD